MDSNAEASSSRTAAAAEDGPALPHLPTPDSFPFPYPQPYGIQLDLMRTVFAALEDRKIAIVESPTGTGKSLTLLTATLSWLGAHGKRLDDAAEASLRARFLAEDPDDPPWVIEHAVKRHMGELRAAAEARAARLAAVRERERRLRRASAAGAFGRKRARVAAEGAVEDVGDNRFLPEDPEGAAPPDSNLSAEVLALMATLDGGRKADEEEEEENVPKVYFASRTHSQLRQLTAELLKTSFPAGKEDGGCDDGESDGVSLVPLASRKQMCINDKVRARARDETRLNEACLDLQKSGGARCEFLPKAEDTRLLDARDAVLATVRDIEDLVLEGRAAGVCPYYATRRAVRQSQLVTLPYNLLLQASAREALGIDLTDQVVVIDEAHNLIDTLLGIYSTTLPASHLSNAAAQLTQYLARFRSRLKPRHALWIAQTLAVLRGLGKVCDNYAIDAGADKTKAKGELIDVNALMARVGGAGDAVNLIELVRYLKESKLSRKVSGYAESLEEAAAAKGGERRVRTTSARHASIAAFHSVEAFLLSLTDARDDGRVILSLDNGAVLVKYVLLNPAERFADVVKSARAIVLAGGTMEPVSDFYSQLFPSVPRDRFATLSCAHVIPKSNLLTQVVCRGPRKLDFEFKFSNRGDDALLAELGAALLSAVGLVPDGVVVFLPSYAFLDKVKAAWGTGLLDKLDQKKKLFYEPQSAAEVDSTLREYARAIDAPEAGPSGRARTGALMFAVVGGKLSEGINFSDRLGRCVVMVGLPFANVGSVELQERMRYVERLPGASRDAANELYTNLCMRAVNQSIGRAIRHANDYAVILLVDRRYGTQRIRSRLPKWIGEDVVVADDWSAAAKGVAAFFREKRARGV
ncbi:ATP-dependent DNA helicase chl1 [Vanrija albida]|uniref:ATP-dependent DNA helicase CHL1 n=1 Tax=Vanrija albida TaxID=181172 RepID=A0ABR3Q8Z0_9TREE